MNLLVGKRKQNPTLGHVYLPRYLKHAWQVLPFAIGRHVPLDETAGVDHFDGSPGVAVMTAGGKSRAGAFGHGRRREMVAGEELGGKWLGCEQTSNRRKRVGICNVAWSGC